MEQLFPGSAIRMPAIGLLPTECVMPLRSPLYSQRSLILTLIALLGAGFLATSFLSTTRREHQSATASSTLNCH
jgi:hypothetical protein